mmetsp:Transcript_12244/g.23718  ORF Transcript_12244/g.23718 Transcript_12244/m.23718 type:complete len:818 (+) Transcript_12244:1908-4361(+)
MDGLRREVGDVTDDVRGVGHKALRADVGGGVSGDEEQNLDVLVVGSVVSEVVAGTVDAHPSSDKDVVSDSLVLLDSELLHGAGEGGEVNTLDGGLCLLKGSEVLSDEVDNVNDLSGVGLGGDVRLGEVGESLDLGGGQGGSSEQPVFEDVGKVEEGSEGGSGTEGGERGEGNHGSELDGHTGSPGSGHTENGGREVTESAHPCRGEGDEVTDVDRHTGMEIGGETGGGGQEDLHTLGGPGGQTDSGGAGVGEPVVSAGSTRVSGDVGGALGGATREAGAAGGLSGRSNGSGGNRRGASHSRGGGPSVKELEGLDLGGLHLLVVLRHGVVGIHTLVVKNLTGLDSVQTVVSVTHGSVTVPSVGPTDIDGSILFGLGLGHKGKGIVIEVVAVLNGAEVLSAHAGGDLREVKPLTLALNLNSAVRSHTDTGHGVGRAAEGRGKGSEVGVSLVGVLNGHSDALLETASSLIGGVLGTSSETAALLGETASLFASLPVMEGLELRELPGHGLDGHALHVQGSVLVSDGLVGGGASEAASLQGVFDLGGILGGADCVVDGARAGGGLLAEGVLPSQVLGGRGGGGAGAVSGGSALGVVLPLAVLVAGEALHSALVVLGGKEAVVIGPSRLGSGDNLGALRETRGSHALSLEHVELDAHKTLIAVTKIGAGGLLESGLGVGRLLTDEAGHDHLDLLPADIPGAILRRHGETIHGGRRVGRGDHISSLRHEHPLSSNGVLQVVEGGTRGAGTTCNLCCGFAVICLESQPVSGGLRSEEHGRSLSVANQPVPLNVGGGEKSLDGVALSAVTKLLDFLSKKQVTVKS